MSSLKTKTDQSPPAGTTLDDFLGGRISVVQPKAGHRAGSDAVWLQAAVPARRGDRVLDAGAGVGVAGLCLLCRSLAEANAARNGVSGHFRVITADLTAPAELLFAKGLAREGYDQLVANPPFHAEGTVRPAPSSSRAAAHIMQDGALEAWIRSLATFAAPKGRLTLIHRPEVLPELLPLLDRRFGAVSFFPLFPKEGAPASRVILHARKGSRGGLRLLQGLILHEADGRYTAKAEAVLRQGEALELGD